MAQQNTTPGGALNVVGKRGPNIDALERVTGRAKYTGDIDIPGMLVGRVLRSTRPHARISRIDTSKAEAVPGVRAVMTYKDAPKVMIFGSRQFALNDRVRFKGEAVAILAAADAETADRALKLIEVEYEPLPFVLDPEEALKPGAPQLFPDGNLEGQPRTLVRGDVEQGLKESDKVIERFYRCPTMWSGGMEPRACVAQWDGDHLTIWAATQAPYRVHGSLTAMFNVPDSNVRVISSYIGGGFGTKSAPHTDEALAAMLARRARLPVKLQYTREEEILDSNTRFETKIYIRLGVKKDMTLHALDVKAYINQGAYHTRLGGLGNQSTHMYKSPNVRTVQYRVHTNIPVPILALMAVPHDFRDALKKDPVAGAAAMAADRDRMEALAKAFEVPIVGLHELSYAWAFAPLMLWFFVAYVRRRAQTDRTRKIVGLKSFYVSVGPIIDRGLQREAAAEVFDAYLKEADDWIATAAAWIKDNMGMTARERFLDRTGMFASSYSTAINETHNNVISNLTRHRQNLSALIERDAWDDH